MNPHLSYQLWRLTHQPEDVSYETPWWDRAVATLRALRSAGRERRMWNRRFDNLERYLSAA